MGIELIALVVFARLLEASSFLLQNAVLLVSTTVFLVLSLSGIITLMRRWDGR
jgi:hypothetical protein